MDIKATAEGKNGNVDRQIRLIGKKKLQAQMAQSSIAMPCTSRQEVRDTERNRRRMKKWYGWWCQKRQRGCSCCRPCWLLIDHGSKSINLLVPAVIVITDERKHQQFTSFCLSIKRIEHKHQMFYVNVVSWKGLGSVYNSGCKAPHYLI